MTVPPPHLHNYRSPKEKKENTTSRKIIVALIFFAFFLYGAYRTLEDVKPGFWQAFKSEIQDGTKPYFK